MKRRPSPWRYRPGKQTKETCFETQEQLSYSSLTSNKVRKKKKSWPRKGTTRRCVDFNWREGHREWLPTNRKKENREGSLLSPEQNPFKKVGVRGKEGGKINKKRDFWEKKNQQLRMDMETLPLPGIRVQERRGNFGSGPQRGTKKRHRAQRMVKQLQASSEGGGL